MKWADDAIACKRKGATPPPLPKGCFGGRTFAILLLLGPLGEKEPYLSIASGVLGTVPPVPYRLYRAACTVPPRPPRCTLPESCRTVTSHVAPSFSVIYPLGSQS